MSVQDKQGEALELLRELFGADPDAVIARMDAVADGADGEAIGDLNAALGQLGARIKSMRLALQPHMSALAAAESAERKIASMTLDEKRALAQRLALDGIEGTSQVRSATSR